MARQLSMTLLVVAFLLLLLAFVAPTAAADALPTEADFKKMKIKQLKQFLDERGLECKGCEEKNDFIKECIKGLNVPVNAAKATKATLEGTLWDAWAQIALDVCNGAASTKGVSEATSKVVCGSIQQATEAVFMQYGKRTANKLRKKPEALLKTSSGDIYQQAGRKMLLKVSNFCFHAKNADKCKSATKVQELLETDNAVKGVKFVTYLTNVGIENTNPMYETLKDKSLNNDEL